MDKRLTTLATLALLGTVQSAASPRKYADPINHTTTGKSGDWVSYSNEYDPLSPSGTPKTATEYQTAFGTGHTATGEAMGYSCIRQGLWYFFTASLDKNVVAAQSSVTHQTMYGQEQTSAKQRVDPTNPFKMKDGSKFETDTVTSNQAVSGRTNGNAACCAKMVNLTAGSLTVNCDNVSVPFGADATTVASTSIKQIPVGRIWYNGHKIKIGVDDLSRYQKQVTTANYANTLSAKNFVITAGGTFASIANDSTRAGEGLKKLADAGYQDASMTNFNTAQATFTFNEDFLFAGLFQYDTSDSTTNFTKCGNMNSTSPATTHAKNWLQVTKTWVNGATANPKAITSNIEKTNKCTFFIAVASDAATTNSAGASFFVGATDLVVGKVQLHYAEWASGNMSTLFPTTSATPYFLGNVAGATAAAAPLFEYPQPVKKSTLNAADTSIYDADVKNLWNDSWYTSVFGMTPGFVLWNSQVTGQYKNLQMAMIDHGYYAQLLTDYNALMTTYNTDAKTYSDLATKYLDAVTKRKAQLADPMKASFETAVAVPKVPCLNNKSPTWAGLNFNTSVDTVVPFTTTATTTSSFAIGWPTIDKIGMTVAGAADKAYVKAPTTAPAGHAFDMHSGYIQFTTNDAASSTFANNYGAAHVYGLMGHMADTDLAKTKTWLTTKKAFRFYKAALLANEKVHYMMVQVLPSDNAATYAKKSITIEVYKNDWEEFTFTPSASVAPTKTVSEADQLGGVKLMAGTAAAFAAIAMTLQ